MYKLLFVDDEPDFLESIQLVFGVDPDYEIQVTSQPELALQKAVKFRPDVIFLDVSMPKMDGGELAIELRDNAMTKNTPIVFITAIVTESERGSHGGQIFLPKPVTSQDIKAVVMDLLT